MIIHLTLNSKYIPMWFFQDEHHNIHLTYLNAGPVEIDYSLLSLENQQYIYQHVELRNIFIEEDKSILTGILTNNKQTVISDLQEIPAVQDFIKQKIEAQALEEKLQKEKTQQTRTTRNKDRVAYLLSKSLKAIKTALRGELDIEFLQLMLNEEKQGQNRSTVISFLSERIASPPSIKVKPKKPYFAPKTSIYDDAVTLEEEDEVVFICKGKVEQ
jgi:hypothetical protein